jgi:hypothetical protein
MHIVGGGFAGRVQSFTETQIRRDRRCGRQAGTMSLDIDTLVCELESSCWLDRADAKIIEAGVDLRAQESDGRHVRHGWTIITRTREPSQRAVAIILRNSDVVSAFGVVRRVLLSTKVV